MRPLYKEHLVKVFIEEMRKNSAESIDKVINKVTGLEHGRKFLREIANVIYEK
ncbi:MAG: hypothetical protein ACOC1K_07705 [Nanoarchaeota archaeon]